MPVSEALRQAVEDLRARTGLDFQISDACVTGTSMHVVYVHNHDLPEQYTNSTGTLGFRVPANFPDTQPEDSFFLIPSNLQLREVEPKRNSAAINRAGVANDLVKDILPDNPSCLVFSWHLWDRVPWDRRKHTLVDHYTHCARRFEQPEHD